MKRLAALCLLCCLCLGCAAGGTATGPAPAGSADALPPDAAQGQETTQTEGDPEMKPERKLKLEIGGDAFTATLADTDAARALAGMLEAGPLTLPLSDYAGFEKVGALGAALPAADRRITTVPGDVMLYQGDQIVLFYGSNTWEYTPLAHVDDLAHWEGALGNGDVTVVLSLEQP